MRDYLMIGPVPSDEDCAQVGQDGYTKRALAECRRFMAQIERHYPIPDHCDAYLTIKRESHDFGDYYEVACVYDMADETASNWAFDVENDSLGVLRTWEVIENV